MEGFNSPIQGYGGWGINQSYMTPSYMANFRPAYGTDGDRENPFARNRTVGEALNRIGPGDYAYGADVLSESSADIHNVVTSTGDAAMAALQHVAIPAAAWYGVKALDQFAGRGSSALGRAAGRASSGAVRGATGLLGRAAGAMGLGRFATAGAPLAGALATGAGGVGAFAGGFMLPIAAATAVGSLADSALIDPYVATRRGMDAMRANTANQFISGSGQTENGGFGMSATRAQQISQALTESGQGDFSLDGSMYNEIADNMMRAGIFQEVGDMDATKVVDGVKKATSVLKLISRVTGDPDILAGIKTLATLKAGGLDDIGKMESAMHRIRQASGASGVSVSQIMDTVGNQGQVMAQQQGLRGVTGLLASADAFAGFTNARRAGIISGGQMQALGGAEGMTQSLMQGTYQTLDSGYGRMLMQGRSGMGASYSDAIGNFGNNFSHDPIATQGDWYANQGAYKEDMMSRNTPDQIMLKALKAQALAMGQDPNDGMVLMAMAQSQGIDPSAARAMAEADRARQNPLTSLRMTESRNTSNRADYVSRLQQDNLGLRGIPVLGGAQQLWMEGSRAFLQGGAEVMSPVTEVVASIADSWESTMAETKGLSHVNNQTTLVNVGKNKKYAMFKGYESKTIKDDSGYMNTGSTKLTESSQYDAKRARLNTLMNSDDPKVSKMARKALAELASGDPLSFQKTYSKINEVTNGYLAGSTTKFRIEADNYAMGQAASSGLFGAEFTSNKIEDEDNGASDSDFLNRISIAALTEDMDTNLGNVVDTLNLKNLDLNMLETLGISTDDLKGKTSAERKAILTKGSKEWVTANRRNVEKNLREEMDRAGRQRNPGAAIDALVQPLDVTNQAVLRALGMTDEDTLGMTAEETKIQIAEKAANWKNRDLDPITGDSQERLRGFYKAAQGAGLTTSDIASGIQASGMNVDAYTSELDTTIGNHNEILNRKIDEIFAEKERREKNQGADKSTDWSNLRDVTDGIGKLGPVLTDNTAAVMANTQAILGNNPSNIRPTEEVVTPSYNVLNNDVGDKARKGLRDYFK